MEKSRPVNPDKQELADVIKRYIMHAQQIANNSDSNYYRAQVFLKSMDRLVSLLDMCRQRKYWRVREIAAYALQCRQSLINVLPYEGNITYSSTCQRLKDILELCESMVKPTAGRVHYAKVDDTLRQPFDNPSTSSG